MRITILYLVLGVLLFSGCARQRLIKEGAWMGVIRIDSTDLSTDVPFNMYYEITPDAQKVMQVSNASENIMITELAFSGDSVFMKFPVYTSEIVALIKSDSLVGRYYPKGRAEGTSYFFYALPGITERFFRANEKATANVSGRWRITENPGTPDSSVMVGEFIQEGDHVTGTILNNGGDYRFLEGKVSGNHFMISAVDGAHTLILTSEIGPGGSMINGNFTGSPRWKSSWSAKRDESAKLTPMEKLVWVKPDSPPFSFRFPDLNSDTVSLSDERYRGKVVAVMAVGTWCPNCLDETIFFKDIYTAYQDKGFEAVALCFEEKTLADSKLRMERFVAHTGATYPFLYAGARARGSLQSVFYNIDGRMAYPTTMFIDRKGLVRRVETGFSGPGTGEHFREYSLETKKFIEQLLAEKP